MEGIERVMTWSHLRGVASHACTHESVVLAAVVAVAVAVVLAAFSSLDRLLLSARLSKVRLRRKRAQVTAVVDYACATQRLRMLNRC
eukprot:10982-Heterococcus_DN1.PRE.2